VLRQLFRSLTRAIIAALVSPPVVGAVYVLGLAAYAGSDAGGLEADVGDVRRAAAMETFISRRFPAEITRMKVGVAATAIALGLVIGLFAELLVRLRHPSANLARRSPRHVFVESAAVVGTLHAMLVMWGMADTPQLYAARWYAQGGLPRLVQILATDWFGPRGVVLLTLALALAYVRPSRIAYLLRRAFGPTRTLLSLIARRGAVSTTTLMLVLSLGLGLAVGLGWPPGAERVGSIIASRIVVQGSKQTAARVNAPERPATSAAAVPTAAALAPNDRPLNVLILAVDSLRNDRLEPKLAPNLTRLAARGTRFDRAYVSAPRTFPSWITILTGRHGHHHGVRSMFPTWEERAKDFDAVPGRFARSGYATTVVSDYAGDIFGRIDLGFANVDTPAFDFRQVIRQKALERETPLLPVLHSHLGRKLFPVMRELSAAADPNLLADDIEATLGRFKKKPFFMTVFFSTAHFPYAAPAPYYGKFTDPHYRGRFKYHKPLGLGSAAELQPDAEDVKQVQALYDGTVSAIDDAAGRVLKRLERLGLADNTIVVVTADHGETLFDHGHGQGHGDHLFGDESTHVPLLIIDPRVAKKEGASGERGTGTGQAGRREGRIVRDVDLAPTLYELTGVAPPSDLDGRSLAPAIRGEALEPRFAYAETELWFTEEIPGLSPELRIPYPGVMGLTELDSRHNAEVVLKKDMASPTLMARHRMVRDERYKLVYVPTRVGVRYMLYDTETDPSESHDIAASMPSEVARLRAELWGWMLKDPQMEQKDGYLVPRESALARGKK
jgi:arylsulfatase A-like enzyme